MKLQEFPPLDTATEAALRASIERFGVLVPVVVDQDGQILDGHHRSRIAGELSVEFETRVRSVADEAEAREIARTLNEDRRHLTVELRRPVVAALREGGHSLRAIAGALGVSKDTVVKDVQVSIPRHLPERTKGQDGKSYPATRQAKTRAERERRRGTRVYKDKPYEATSERQRQLARGQLDRLIDGLSQIHGVCTGLRDLDLHMVAAACHNGELSTWIDRASEAHRRIGELKRELKEVQHGA